MIVVARMGILQQLLKSLEGFLKCNHQGIQAGSQSNTFGWTITIRFLSALQSTPMSLQLSEGKLLQAWVLSQNTRKV